MNYGCSSYENALQEKHPSKRERKWRPLRGLIALCLIATEVCLAWVPHAVAAERKMGSSLRKKNGVKSTIDPWKIECYMLKYVTST